jgi:hypothetical protein
MKRKHHIIIALLPLVFSFKIHAQAFYDCNSKIKYKRFYSYIVKNKDSTETKLYFNFKHTPGLDSVKICLQHISEPGTLWIKILKGKKVIQKIKTNQTYWLIESTELAYVGDINNDSLPDIKIIVPSMGCGLGGSMSTKLYLFQNKKGKFDKIEFFDFAFENECDMNDDSIYEIISTDHISYNGHSYWVHNIFNYKNGALVNMDEQYGYPLWTRHLNYSDNKVARRIPEKIRMKYKLEYPFPIN